jgi:methyl-accepting chemotaxis protein
LLGLLRRRFGRLAAEPLARAADQQAGSSIPAEEPGPSSPLDPDLRAFLTALRAALQRDLRAQRADLDRVSRLVGEATDGLSAAFRRLEAQGRAQHQVIGSLLVAMDVGETAGASRGVQEVLGQASAALQLLTDLLKEIDQTSRTGLASSEAMAEQMNATLKLLSGINTIAHQTHVLSINATIEASRVGQQGKGFEVVAKEVGDLARYSKGLARNIADQITRTKEALHMVRANLQSVSVMGTQAAEAAGQQAGQALGEMERLRGGILDGLSAVDKVANELGSSVADAVRCLQFGDIVGQLVAAMVARIDRLSSASDCIEGLLSGTPPADLAQRLASLTLALAQEISNPVSAASMAEGNVELF